MHENTKSTCVFFYELAVLLIALVAFAIADISNKIGGVSWLKRRSPLHLE